VADELGLDAQALVELLEVVPLDALDDEGPEQADGGQQQHHLGGEQPPEHPRAPHGVDCITAAGPGRRGVSPPS
jgi:hypothetical protein